MRLSDISSPNTNLWGRAKCLHTSWRTVHLSIQPSLACHSWMVWSKWCCLSLTFNVLVCIRFIAELPKDDQNDVVYWSPWHIGMFLIVIHNLFAKRVCISSTLHLAIQPGWSAVPNDWSKRRYVTNFQYIHVSQFSRGRRRRHYQWHCVSDHWAHTIKNSWLQWINKTFIIYSNTFMYHR